VGSLPTRNGFDSRYWSMPSSLHNSPVLTVYLYLLVFVVFFVFYQDASRNQQLPLLSDLHNRSADRFRKVSFTLILLTFLGTPVTLGFTYKLTVLSGLSASTPATAAAIGINLVMLVFYLQASRHPQLSRKKKASAAPQDVSTSSKGLVVLVIFLTLAAAAAAPLLADILSALLG
jgi:NADH:ubiquinone oxidoreductase subunit 2 (subunit N)